MRAGFTGGLVVDYPNSRKAKKFFLCLMVGSTAGGMSQRQAEAQMPKALEGDGEEHVRNERKREKQTGGRRKSVKDASKEKGTKEWVLRKKELDRKRGSEKS
jgi:18S rRNA (guanine1575-N7)-methyltransferase